MADSLDALISSAEFVSTASTTKRVRIFRDEIPSILNNLGSENVQAAQKYITGLDARRLSKLSEYSEDSEEDMSSS